MSSPQTKRNFHQAFRKLREHYNQSRRCEDVRKNGIDLPSLLLALLPFWICLAICSLLMGGCSTPFFATDNPVWLRLPGAERKSDKIEGVLRPWERASLILEKGDKGRQVNAEEKAILLQQLTDEYRVASSPNIRRACIDAMGRITSNMPSESAEKIFSDALIEPNLGVRISAIDAWGMYCQDKPDEYAKARRLAAEKLCARFKELPYSVEPGAKKQNDERKDLRLTIIRNLGTFRAEDSPELMPTFKLALEGEQLDDGALQLATMRSLEKMTGKKYGLDAHQWSEYISYALHNRAEAPKELSIFERMEAPDLPMFK